MQAKTLSKKKMAIYAAILASSVFFFFSVYLLSTESKKRFSESYSSGISADEMVQHVDPLTTFGQMYSFELANAFRDAHIRGILSAEDLDKIIITSTSSAELAYEIFNPQSQRYIHFSLPDKNLLSMLTTSAPPTVVFYLYRSNLPDNQGVGETLALIVPDIDARLCKASGRPVKSVAIQLEVASSVHSPIEFSGELPNGCMKDVKGRFFYINSVASRIKKNGSTKWQWASG